MQNPDFWRNGCLLTSTLFLLGGITDRMISGSPLVSMLFFSLPPILLLYGLYVRRISLIQWMGFVLMLQFIVSVLRLIQPGYMPLRLAVLACCILAFICAVWFIYSNRIASSPSKRSST